MLNFTFTWEKLIFGDFNAILGKLQKFQKRNVKKKSAVFFGFYLFYVKSLFDTTQKTTLIWKQFFLNCLFLINSN